jgi:SAM-dependent methyltransferase
MLPSECLDDYVGLAAQVGHNRIAMSSPEFDPYAGQYDHVLSAAIPDGLNENGYFAEYKIALMAARMKGKKANKILDFGCGTGRSLHFLERYFPDAELWGHDVSPASLEIAAQRAPRAKLISDRNAIPVEYFDAIIAANVFHHIHPDQRLQALVQCRSFLAGRGQMFLFEHNPFNPVTRRIFERCPFDAGAEMLSLKLTLDLAKAASFNSEQHGYTLFFPRPFAFLRGLEPWLEHLPLGAQYYVQMEK